jgi:hypothetical protein
MQGKSRKGNTYYACGYRIDYGDKAAEALGHGKWQYVNEKVLVPIVDGFFATRIFGAQRLEHFQSQSKSLSTAVNGQSEEKRQRLQKIVSDIDTRLDRQLAAIEAGVDPSVVAERIRQLESKREEARELLADLKGSVSNKRDQSGRRTIGVGGLARPLLGTD